MKVLAQVAPKFDGLDVFSRKQEEPRFLFVGDITANWLRGYLNQCFAV